MSCYQPPNNYRLSFYVFDAQEDFKFDDMELPNGSVEVDLYWPVSPKEITNEFVLSKITGRGSISDLKVLQLSNYDND